MNESEFHRRRASNSLSRAEIAEFNRRWLWRWVLERWKANPERCERMWGSPFALYLWSGGTPPTKKAGQE